MMKTYYIPTTTLNIDNILSTESVAPLSFYKSREYGYNKFERIARVPYSNVLLMCSRIPHFKIEDSELNSFPMVLEVSLPDDNAQIRSVGKCDNVTFYTTDNVLRLTPYTTKVFFFEHTDLRAAKLSCSDSLTNKLGEKFAFEVRKGDFELTTNLVENLKIIDNCENYDLKVQKDNRINKIKGFVFGYYLGVSKSLSPDSAECLKLRKKIYDTIASNKSKRRNNNDINNKLKELYIECKNYASSTKNGLPPISLRHDKLEDFALISERIAAKVSEDRDKSLETFSVNSTFDLDPSFETCRIIGNDNEETSIYNEFINEILWRRPTPTPESLRTNRFNIATEITRTAKTIWESRGKQWENSETQSFMNDLRKNIKNFEPFDINRHNSAVLKSVAIYILKGEDYESLVQFCEDNSINDYRYALALWGATQGYVKIPRPAIAPLMKSAAFDKTLRDIITLLYNYKLPPVEVTPPKMIDNIIGYVKKQKNIKEKEKR